MLRTPFLSSSSLRLSSLSIISRSVAQILNSYATLAQVFIASYGELKRIMTCGYLLCVCFWERELDRNETEALMGLCEWLVSKLEQAERQGDGGVARGKGEILRKLSGLLGESYRSLPFHSGSSRLIGSIFTFAGQMKAELNEQTSSRVARHLPSSPRRTTSTPAHRQWRTGRGRSSLQPSLRPSKLSTPCLDIRTRSTGRCPATSTTGSGWAMPITWETESPARR